MCTHSPLDRQPLTAACPTYPTQHPDSTAWDSSGCTGIHLSCSQESIHGVLPGLFQAGQQRDEMHLLCLRLCYHPLEGCYSYITHHQGSMDWLSCDGIGTHLIRSKLLAKSALLRLCHKHCWIGAGHTKFFVVLCYSSLLS